MADPLYLSFWFPSFDEAEILPRTLAILQQFPFSQQHPGVTNVAVHPVDWSEATVFERRFRPGVEPEQAVETVAEFLHDDYAYGFELHWDLWTPREEDSIWQQVSRRVRLTAHGKEFDQQVHQQEGHIRVDLGLDSAFLYEDVPLSPAGEERIRANVQKLVAFTHAVESNCGTSARLLWSESEENLAQKLITRLQKVH